MIVKHPFEDIRRACKEVAANATRVHINYDHLPAYAASLPVQMAVPSELDPGYHYLGKEEKTVAFLLTLDSINFGSGYFPHLRKRPGMSGYFSIASSLNDVYKSHGCLSAADLDRITVEKCTRIFGQDPANQIIRELMQHFATALNDLGRYLLDGFKGNFIALVESAELSAGRLVWLLNKMPYFNDVGLYKGIEVPFYMRWSLLRMKFEKQGKPSTRRNSITSSGIAVSSPITKRFHDTGPDAFFTSRD